MVCKYYHENNNECKHSLPVVPSYINFICVQFPEKCPVFLWKHAALTKDTEHYEGAIDGTGEARLKLKTFGDSPVVS